MWLYTNKLMQFWFAYFLLNAFRLLCTGIVLEGPRQKAWILSFSVPNFLLLHFIGYCFSGVFWLGWSARMYCNMRWSIYALVYKNMITCKCISGLHNWRRWNSERVFGDFRGISTLHASKRIFSNNFWSIQ